MSELIDKIKSIIFNWRKDPVLMHEATGESCHVCGNEMKTKQGITMVGSGEKMHSKCWPKFFDFKAQEIINRRVNCDE